MATMNASSKKQFEMPTPRALLPIGHPDRDRATLFLLTVSWRDTQCTLATWEKTVRELEQERIWERYPPDNPYGSIDALLKAEIGFTADESISAITKRTQQALADKEREQRKLGKVGNPTGNNQYTETERNPSDSKVSKSYGETTDYLLDRIERDFPETYQDVKDGKFRSTRQAAISVGIVKKDDRWSAPGPIEKLAALIRKRYTPEEIADLVTILQGTNS